MALEHADDADLAIQRVDGGDAVDVVVLGAGVPDPVRVAQRLHSLDRDGAVIVVTDAEGEADLRHALDVAPFLDGDVSMLVRDDAAALADGLAAAAQRTQTRREASAARKKRRETPPPLSARYLGTLLDSVPIGLVTLDETGAVIGWNKRTGEMLEVPEVEQLGKPFADLFPESDRPRLALLIDRLGSAGIEEEPEIFERTGRSFEVTGARFTIRSGEGGTLLILQDVSKRRAAEREVDVQRALLAAQADSSIVAIAVVTLDGQIERINKRWTEMWGVDTEVIRRDREQATQAMLEQLVDPDAFIAGIEQLAGGIDCRDELVLRDGRVIERFGTHVHDEAGEPIGRIWFHTDITTHRREEDALRFLADATNLLSSSLDYETTLQHLTDLAITKMSDWCSVEIGDAGTSHPVAMAHRDPEKVALGREFRTRYPERNSGMVAEVTKTGQSQVFSWLTDEDLERLSVDEEHLALLHSLGLRSVMIVPIKVRDRVFGAINFVRGQGPPYDDDDVRLAEELARRAAIAIDNSRVHAELRETARTLQESLLPPHLPAVRGLELAARFRPAGAGIQVGGDFYDIFDVSDDQWGIAIGDVCGKGAEAAALTALTRYTVRAAAMYESSAGGVLSVLNQALIRQRGDFRFTTLTYCILDLAAKELRVSSGGHPRPLVLRSDGTIEPVGAAGPLLGVIGDAEFGEERVTFGQGDVVVLYTDGLTDALAPARILSEDDLIQELRGCAGLTAGEISGRLEHFALGDDPQRRPRDDVALVVARLN